MIYVLDPKSLVITLNPKNPDVGTCMGSVYFTKKTTHVFWGEGWAKRYLTRKEYTDLNKLIKKLLKSRKGPRRPAKMLCLTGNKRKGFNTRVLKK